MHLTEFSQNITLESGRQLKGSLPKRSLGRKMQPPKGVAGMKSVQSTHDRTEQGATGDDVNERTNGPDGRSLGSPKRNGRLSMERFHQ